jgi:glyoxylase-like metal-dependent hydrolase (beta-lactamase superfamily II)
LIRFFVFDEFVTAHFSPESTAHLKSDKGAQYHRNLHKGDNIEIIPGIRVFIGSKHTFENQFLLVNSNSKSNKILIASDAIWFYYNLNNLLPATLCLDPKAYVEAMKRMKTLVTNPDFIIPGHDDLVFSKFPTVSEWVAKIGN